MFALALGKARTGAALGNLVLTTEGRITLIDGLLAVAVLAGLVLNAGLGWWWADSVAGYVLLALRRPRGPRHLLRRALTCGGRSWPASPVDCYCWPCCGRTKPDTARLRDVLLLPDLIRLLRSLAANPQLPRGVRVRLILLLAYLLSPIDLVPDFIPILGYADNAIIVAIALRSVTRRAGTRALARHPGRAGHDPEPGRVARRLESTVATGVPANDTANPAELPTTTLMMFSSRQATGC